MLIFTIEIFTVNFKEITSISLVTKEITSITQEVAKRIILNVSKNCWCKM